MGASLSFVSWLWGAGYWHSYTWNDKFAGVIISAIVDNGPPMLKNVFPERGLMNCEILVLMGFMAALQEFTLKVLHVVKNYGIKSVLNLFPFLSMIACFIAMFSTDVGSTLLDSNPRASMILYGCLFFEMVCGLMTDHMIKKDYSPIRTTLLPLYLLTLAVFNKLPGIVLDFATFEQYYQMYVGDDNGTLN